MKTSRIARSSSTLAVTAALVAGCALRASDVRPLQADPAEFAGWSCERIEDESDRVQRQATQVAYAFDERAGNNIIAMGVGLVVFWPALLTMRPQGPDATVLAALKGRHEALQAAAAARPCPPAPDRSAARAAALPVAVGDRLIYEQRQASTGPLRTIGLRVSQVRRDELELEGPATGAGSAVWVSDASGNLRSASIGPVWPELMRSDLVLGQTVGGMLRQPGEALQWARVRGQVMAVGPQTIAGVTFDVAVVELFGDAHDGDVTSRLDGVLVLDRSSGLHLRLDLFSGQPAWQLQRRLVRVERAAVP